MIDDMVCLVIAISVAEEGLNFPASRIVVTLSVCSDFLFNLSIDDNLDGNDEDITDLVDPTLCHSTTYAPSSAHTHIHCIFQSTMRLPRSLPLPPRHLSYLNPKKENRRPVVFLCGQAASQA